MDTLSGSYLCQFFFFFFACFWKGVYLKGKTLFPTGSRSFPYSVDPFLEAVVVVSLEKMAEKSTGVSRMLEAKLWCMGYNHILWTSTENTTMSYSPAKKSPFSYCGGGDKWTIISTYRLHHWTLRLLDRNCKNTQKPLVWYGKCHLGSLSFPL